MRKNKKLGRYRFREFLLILSLMMTIAVLPTGAIASTNLGSDVTSVPADTPPEPSPTPAEPSPTPTEPVLTAPVSSVQVDVNQSTVTATTTSLTAGQSFALTVTVRDTTSAHGLITGLSSEDFHLAAFEAGTQTAMSDEIMKNAVIETFPGVYTVTVEPSSPQSGMDIEVTVKGLKLAGEVSNMMVSTGPLASACPNEAAIRQYKIAAVQGSLSNAVYALDQDASAIEKGEMQPAPLILRAALGECLEIELTNRLSIPVSFPIGKGDGSQGIQSLAPGEKTAIKYFAEREGTLIIRHLSDVLDEPQPGLYGAVIIEPASTRFLDPRTGRLNGTGLQANIQGPGADDDFRESVSLFRERGPDLDVYEEEVVYQTVVNFPIATQKDRKVSLGLSNYDPAMGTPPMGTFRAYAGDPVRLRVVNANDERVISFGIDGHTWPSKYGTGDHVYNKAVSDKIVAPLETLDALLDGGAGGMTGQAGYYIWGNSRLPYIQADEWGLLEVLSGQDANLLPLADRNPSHTTIMPSTSTPTQNEHLTLNIIGATNATGEPLGGLNHVTVTSSVYSEGTNGIVYDSDTTFENGSTEIQVTLTQPGEQSLIVQIAGAAVSQPVFVNVMPEDHGGAAIIPSTTTPTQNDPFALEIDEAKGASGTYLNGSIHVAVKCSTDTLVFEDDVQFTDGWAKIPVKLAQTGEQVLTVQIAGITDALTAQVNVQQSQPSTDLSTASVTPSTAAPTQNKSFTLNITEAKGKSGDYLAGQINVQVTSNNPVFNADVEFTNGSAEVPIILADPGEQTLTIQIAGVTTVKSAAVNVQVDDRSTAVVTASTSTPMQNQAFDLNVTGAKGTNGEDLTGSITMQVTSGNTSEGTNGVIYSGSVQFTSGAATVPLTLTKTGEQSLTVQISGVTASQNVAVNVQAPADLSAATVTASTLKPIEKRSFTLQITGAKGFTGVDLTGAIQVQVKSSDDGEGKDGVVYNGSALFTNGSAALRIILERRGPQILTVTITGVTATQTLKVDVVRD